jgi:predicted HAD superfamily Cof-like phosphohydrolase
MYEEEFKEFIVAYEKKKPHKMADALCDIIYFAHGTGQCLGINTDDLLDKMGIYISTHMINPSIFDIFTEKQKVIELGMKRIEDALIGFRTATQAENLEELTTYLAYILQETYTLGYNLGFDMNAMFREVHRSNMTKMCPTYEDAVASVDFYVKEGRYNKPAIRAKTNIGFVVFNDDEDKKILKYYKWKKPNLKQFFEKYNQSLSSSV